MRAFFVVLLLFGAFMSVAGLNKVSSAVHESLAVPLVTPVITPHITPLPTEITPTQIPQTDFCLNIPILMYHHVQPMDIAVAEGHGQLTVDSNTFDQHMAYLLAQGYHMVSVADVVNAVRSHQQLPEKSIAITIDDGYKDNYEYAYQTAKKYNIKMDFMIPTGLIGNPGYMTWDDLKEMSQDPRIGIYNHTWSHASLGAADRVTIEREVMTAQKQLEEKLGVKNSIFVYPYGSYSPLAIEILREKGFNAAVTTIQGTLQCESTIMELQRTRIGNTSLSFYL